jgi:hypothetical protein
MARPGTDGVTAADYEANTTLHLRQFGYPLSVRG